MVLFVSLKALRMDGYGMMKNAWGVHQARENSLDMDTFCF
jgi:hypothetical protein